MNHVSKANESFEYEIAKAINNSNKISNHDEGKWVQINEKLFWMDSKRGTTLAATRDGDEIIFEKGMKTFVMQMMERGT